MKSIVVISFLLLPALVFSQWEDCSWNELKGKIDSFSRFFNERLMEGIELTMELRVYNTYDDTIPVEKSQRVLRGYHGLLNLSTKDEFQIQGDSMAILINILERKIYLVPPTDLTAYLGSQIVRSETKPNFEVKCYAQGDLVKYSILPTTQEEFTAIDMWFNSTGLKQTIVYSSREMQTGNLLEDRVNKPRIEIEIKSVLEELKEPIQNMDQVITFVENTPIPIGEFSEFELIDLR